MLRGRHPLHALYERLGARYPLIAVVLVVAQGHLVVLVSLLAAARFVELSLGEWFLAFVVAQSLTGLETAIVVVRARRALRPVVAWHDDQEDEDRAVAAWKALTDLPNWPIDAMTALRDIALTLPVVAVLCLAGDLPLIPSGIGLTLGSIVIVATGVLVRFLEMDLVLRPVIEQVAGHLPPGPRLPAQSVSLKWRIIVAVPLITLVTGSVVAVAGAGSGRNGLDTLSVGVAVALFLTVTLAVGLSAVLARSLITPLREVQAAVDDVGRGEFNRQALVLAGDEVGQLARSFNVGLSGLAERDRLREGLAAYVDPILVPRLMAEGPRLPAEAREVSVAFVDIRGFTSFSEGRGAADVFALLNEFYGVVVPVVESHGGHANAFQGDGLLAVFGAPVALESHADAAVAASIAVARVVRQHFGGDLKIGVGVNSGAVVAGTIGGGGRVAFTVIGDAVNTASRVEAVTRRTGDIVLLTEETRRRLTQDHGTLSVRPPEAVHGKRRPVRLHAPLLAGRVDDPLPEIEAKLGKLVDPWADG